jgi:hypothetical protein
MGHYPGKLLTRSNSFIASLPAHTFEDNHILTVQQAPNETRIAVGP